MFLERVILVKKKEVFQGNVFGRRHKMIILVDALQGAHKNNKAWERTTSSHSNVKEFGDYLKGLTDRQTKYDF